MLQRSDVGAKCAAAYRLEIAVRAFGRHRRQTWQQRGEDALSAGLADRAEADRGRDEICEHGDDEGGQGRFQSEAVAGGRGADRDGVSDGIAAGGG